MENKTKLLATIQTTIDFSKNWKGTDNFNHYFNSNDWDFWQNNIDLWCETLKSVIKVKLEEHLESRLIQGVSIEIEITGYQIGSLKIIVDIFLKIDPNLAGRLSGLAVEEITRSFNSEMPDSMSSLIAEITAWFVETGISLIQQCLKEKLNKKAKELLSKNTKYPLPKKIINVNVFEFKKLI